MGNMSDKRITFIVGAGAPLDLKLPNTIVWPSTHNITQEVIKPYANYFDPSNPITIVQQIYDILINKFPAGNQNPWADAPKGPNINFEQLFHVLEMLDSYSPAWRGDCKAPHLYPVFAPFTQPSCSLSVEPIHGIMKEFIIRIMDIVNAYNEYVLSGSQENQWYRDFYFNFRENTDFYIFNYDTTIEDIIQEYEDGFEPDGIQTDFLQFNPKRLLSHDKPSSTINHLHGCINYYPESYKNRSEDIYTFLSHDLYKYPSYKEVRNMMIGRVSGDPSSQSGETYHAAPIITGLRKTDKLNSIPFDFYHGNMYKSIINNNAMVIIGYSFGDLYCNQLIERLHFLHKGNRRIVLIDFWDIPKEHQSLHGGHFISHNLGHFLCRAMEVQDFDSAIAELYANKDKNTGALYSKNGCLMVLPQGLKEASKAYSDILHFINS